jgi:phenylpropionate dioxygenase-like ring-hydroxylating dioxygenase large terminal subunit
MVATPHPPAGSGRWSVAFPRRWWYPVCTSAELGSTPVSATLMDLPLVVFRDRDGTARGLVDRCPHRNVPLSDGRVRTDGSLECRYHGWRFDGRGRCLAVPGLSDLLGDEPTTRDATSRPVLEQDGIVWVWGDDDEPCREPFALPDLGTGRGVGQVVFRRDMGCTLHASLENVLDVPHTAFLHGGAFRSRGGRPVVTAARHDLPDGVEVRFVGEPAGFGPLQLPGATFDHWDRFFLPSVAQVEYRIDDRLTIVNSVLHLPLSARRTRAWFVLRFRSPLPARAIAPLVRARARAILGQDVEALEAQTANIRRFGGERYTSTDLDLLGNAIWRLLRSAERLEQGEDGSDADPEVGAREVTLRL